MITNDERQDGSAGPLLPQLPFSAHILEYHEFFFSKSLPTLTPTIFRSDMRDREYWAENFFVFPVQFLNRDGIANTSIASYQYFLRLYTDNLELRKKIWHILGANNQEQYLFTHLMEKIFFLISQDGNLSAQKEFISVFNDCTTLIQKNNQIPFDNVILKSFIYAAESELTKLKARDLKAAMPDFQEVEMKDYFFEMPLIDPHSRYKSYPQILKTNYAIRVSYLHRQQQCIRALERYYRVLQNYSYHQAAYHRLEALTKLLVAENNKLINLINKYHVRHEKARDILATTMFQLEQFENGFSTTLNTLGHPSMVKQKPDRKRKHDAFEKDTYLPSYELKKLPELLSQKITDTVALADTHTPHTQFSCKPD